MRDNETGAFVEEGEKIKVEQSNQPVREAKEEVGWEEEHINDEIVVTEEDQQEAVEEKKEDEVVEVQK